MDRATTGKLHDNWQFRKQMDLLLARSTPRPMPGQVGWIQQVNGGSDLKQAKSKKAADKPSLRQLCLMFLVNALVAKEYESMRSIPFQIDVQDRVQRSLASA